MTEQKIFAAVGGYYQGLTKGPGNIYFYAIPNKNLSPKDIDIKINDVLKNVIKKVLVRMILIERKRNTIIILSISKMELESQPKLLARHYR